MSLEILIDTVAEKITKNKEEILIIVNNLIENLGKKFTDRGIHSYCKSYSFEESDIFLLINDMSKLEMVEKKKHYHCLISTEESSVDFSINECEFCHEEISNNNHEYEVNYKIRNSIIQLITNKYNKFIVDKYVNKALQINLINLVENKEYIIPFFGAGLSVPLKYPSWKKLLVDLKSNLEEDLRPAFQRYIDTGNYLKALDFLKDNSLLSTEDLIKDAIIENFPKDNKNLFNEDNNYFDLYELKSDFYLTTNYDNVFTEIATKLDKFTYPFIWEDLKDLQKLYREKRQRVIHLHGNIEKPGSMIVTEKDYKTLYDNKLFRDNLLSIMSNKSILFLGFSFNDQFFEDIYFDIISQVKGKHYIIVPNVTIPEAQLLTRKNLHVIGINVEVDNEKNYVLGEYIKAVRCVLKQLA